MARKTKTQKTKLWNLLIKGGEVTSENIRKRLKIANPSAVVHSLREDGAAIYCNERTVRGKKVMKYRASLSQSAPIL